MAIDTETIQQTIKLAKLRYKTVELEQFEDQFDRIVDMVEQLDEMDTEGIRGTYHGIELRNVLREDKPADNIDRQDLLDNAKTHKDGFIQVPAMIGSEEEGEA